MRCEVFLCPFHAQICKNWRVVVSFTHITTYLQFWFVFTHRHAKNYHFTILWGWNSVHISWKFKPLSVIMLFYQVNRFSALEWSSELELPFSLLATHSESTHSSSNNYNQPQHFHWNCLPNSRFFTTQGYLCFDTTWCRYWICESKYTTKTNNNS